jgi:hypothetical protein
MHDGQGFLDYFNQGSSWCTALYDGWHTAINEDRAWFSDEEHGDYGGYYGLFDGGGQILVTQRALNAGSKETARTVMHEVAHDFGCEENGDAEAWAQYCVYDGQSPPHAPPQYMCPGLA